MLLGEPRGVRGERPRCRWCRGCGWSVCSWFASLVSSCRFCSSEPPRRLGSTVRPQCKGAPGGRTRSAAAGEHRTGEDAAKRTLVLRPDRAKRRKEAAPKSRSDAPGRNQRGGADRCAVRNPGTTARGRRTRAPPPPRGAQQRRRTPAGQRPASDSAQWRRPQGGVTEASGMEARRGEIRVSGARCEAREPGPQRSGGRR